MSKSENPLIVALRAVFGPLVKQSSKWPPVLAYGLPGIVAVLLIALLRSAVPDNLTWLLAVVILAPLVAYIVTDYKWRQDQLAPPAPAPMARGNIDAPIRNQLVGRTIHCNGSATGIKPDMHLWLAIEANRFIWPKEGEVYVDNQNRWSATIFEDGATKKFAIALLLADSEANKFIQEWLEEGKRKGEFAEMKGIPGTKRLDRVDGLRLSRAH